MSAKTDHMYGRQGGRFVATGYTPAVIDGAPRCDVCGHSMILGQRKRHYVCDPLTRIGKTVHLFCRSGLTRAVPRRALIGSGNRGTVGSDR